MRFQEIGTWTPSTGRVALAAAALCLLAYFPFFWVPLISDDYLQIGLARMYGSWPGQQALFADPLYRCRATSLWLTWVADRLFGAQAVPLASLCLALHWINCLLVFSLGSWKRIGWPISAAAAFFFAVYEGHQEAVIWIAAMPELLVFTFGLACILGWMRWLQGGGRRWLALTGVAYPLALISKESAVIVPALLVLYAFVEDIPWRRWIIPIAIFGVLTVLYTLSIFEAKRSHLHFNDGTFSLSAPFLKTLVISIGRLFWFWGALALVAGLWSRSAPFLRTAAIALVWIVVTFLPYVFLTYMPRVPSRHTYWASAGLALLVGAALVQGLPRLTDRKLVLAGVVAAMIAHNCGYLWTKKLGQYQERARSTEELIEFSRRTPGLVRVRCFPYGSDIIYYALEIADHRQRAQIEINAQATGDSYCFVAHED
ncbi:MAG: hypothetical protein ABI972_04830 [Acidobacteriota bacterium]